MLLKIFCVLEDRSFKKTILIKNKYWFNEKQSMKVKVLLRIKEIFFSI